MEKLHIGGTIPHMKRTRYKMEILKLKNTKITKNKDLIHKIN